MGPTAQRAALVALLAGAGLLGASAGGGCRPTSPPPSLVLIVIDTLRADRLGAYGHELGRSPELDRLAREGTLFLNARAPSSWTRPSMASLFTSRWPSEHGAVSIDRPLAASVPTLAERLREAGYRTVGVSGNFVHVNADSGLARGFDVFRSFSRRVEGPVDDKVWTHELPEGERMDLRAPHAEEINQEVLRSLPASSDGSDGSDGPIFLYVHYMEPHSPYGPAGPGAAIASNEYVLGLAARGATLGERERDRLLGLYDAEITAVDAGIGRLLAELGERGLLEDAVVVVTSDHGEEFGEHGGWFHGLTLHAESLRVPLLLHGPGRVPGGARRTEPVDLLDVPTTLLALAGASPAEGMRGRRLLADEIDPGASLVAELHEDPGFEARVRPRRHRLALTRWPWKAIVGRTRVAEVYQLERDPEERSPLAAERAPDSLLAAARELASQLGDAAPHPGGLPLDEATLEGLRALGYAP